MSDHAWLTLGVVMLVVEGAGLVVQLWLLLSLFGWVPSLWFLRGVVLRRRSRPQPEQRVPRAVARYR